jgi:DNA-binding YbaB/EbfC family protein
MLDKMKAMGALAGLMKNQDRLKDAAERVRAQLKETRVVGESGSGAVRVTFSGELRALDVEVSPSLASGMDDDSSRALAQELIAEATNDGLKKAQQAAHAIVAAEAEALGLGDLMGEGGLPGIGKLLEP